MEQTIILGECQKALDFVTLRVGFVCGAFDLLHPGHILMLEDAKAQCDWLVVGLHIDPSIERPEKNKPVLAWTERCKILGAVKYIDEIRAYDTEKSLLTLLESLKPDVRILGSDWRGKSYTGEHLGIPIYWHERNHNWSSSEMKRRVWKAEEKAMFESAI